MATKASTLLRAARKASLASRAAAAAASRAAAMASRSAHVAGLAADVARAARLRCDLRAAGLSDLLSHPRSCINRRFPTSADYKHLPYDSKTPTDKDLESDEAVWALYKRWCKAFDKKRDHAEMVRRFKIVRYNAQDVHRHNTDVPEDPEEAAICLQKRRETKLLISKGEDVSHFDERHLPKMLGPLADGGDPSLRERDYSLLKDLEKSEARCAAKDVTV